LISRGSESNKVLAAEQRLLGYLIAPATPPEIVRNILERLQAYRFRNLGHQVLFECIARLRTGPRSEILALLPAQLVRAGFPDFDWRRFVERCPPRAEDAMELCSELVPDPSP
jgi:hypothetical protein